MSQNSPAGSTGVTDLGTAGSTGTAIAPSAADSTGTAIAPSAADSANTSANTYDIEFFWDPI